MNSLRHRCGAAIWLASVCCSVAANAAVPLTGATAPNVPPPIQAEGQSMAAIIAELDRDPDTIVADIGPRTVTRADVAAAIRDIPPPLTNRPIMEVYQQAVAMAMQQKILAVRAVDAGLDKLPSVIFRLRAADEDVLADAYLRGALDANITEDVLKKAYDLLVAGKPGPDQVKARIVVTDTESEAEAAIVRIKLGASFDDVARTASTDSTAADGGDLGYVGAAGLAPEVAAVIFSLGVGSMTAHPVYSGDHWFVIKSEGRRVSPAPTFDEARPALAHELAVIEIARIKQEAVSRAKIVYRGMLAEAAPDGRSK